MLNDGEIVTPIITSFEIYFENDNDTLANNELPKAKANHSTGVQSGKESGSVNPIAMELFSPYADFEAIPIEKIRNNSESMAPSEIPATTATTKTPNQINRDQVVNIFSISFGTSITSVSIFFCRMTLAIMRTLQL